MLILLDAFFFFAHVHEVVPSLDAIDTTNTSASKDGPRQPKVITFMKPTAKKIALPHRARPKVLYSRSRMLIEDSWAHKFREMEWIHNDPKESFGLLDLRCSDSQNGCVERGDLAPAASARKLRVKEAGATAIERPLLHPKKIVDFRGSTHAECQRSYATSATSVEFESAKILEDHFGDWC